VFYCKKKEKKKYSYDEGASKTSQKLQSINIYSMKNFSQFSKYLLCLPDDSEPTKCIPACIL